MRATKSKAARALARRRDKTRKAAHAARPAAVKPAVRRPVAVPPVEILYRVCKPGWAVVVERAVSSLGTRFVCPFCPQSHRVPGPVRGFRKLPRARWSRLRRVEE